MATVKLPAYVKKKPLAAGRVGYFWERPSWADPKHAKSDDEARRRLAVRNGKTCPVASTPLGTDVAEAITKGEALVEAFRQWCTGEGARLTPGTIRWLFAWYREQDEYLSRKFITRKGYKDAMTMVEEIAMKNGVFGDRRATAIDTEAADKLYKLARTKHGERQGGYMMQVCRLVWNVAGRRPRETGIPHKQNPFSGMGISSSSGKAKGAGNRNATRAEYDSYREAARAMGKQSMATAAALCFEGCQRVWDAFGFEDPDGAVRGIKWEGYRPGEWLDLVQSKTGTFVRIPLSDMLVTEGTPEKVWLFPELEAELALSRAGLDSPSGMIVLDERTGQPYTYDYMAKLHRRIRKKAGLPADLRFTSFRHGGATEIGDSGEADTRAATGHKTLDTTAIYNKANIEKARRIALMRRQHIAQITAGDGKEDDNEQGI